MTARITALLAATLVVAVPSLATEADPDVAIKYRKNVMKPIGGATGNIGAILKGEVPHQDKLGELVQLLATAANPEITIPAFRQNTHDEGFERTTATAKIWENWDDFEGRLKKLGEVTRAAAEAGDQASMTELKPVFDTCKGCHDEYREKQ